MHFTQNFCPLSFFIKSIVLTDPNTIIVHVYDFCNWRRNLITDFAVRFLRAKVMFSLHHRYAHLFILSQCEAVLWIFKTRLPAPGVFYLICLQSLMSFYAGWMLSLSCNKVKRSSLRTWILKKSFERWLCWSCLNNYLTYLLQSIACGSCASTTRLLQSSLSTAISSRSPIGIPVMAAMYRQKLRQGRPLLLRPLSGL